MTRYRVIRRNTSIGWPDYQSAQDVVKNEGKNGYSFGEATSWLCLPQTS